MPCERIFSSAKETDTAKRNNISPALMEALQMLKFSYKKDRLNFTAGWTMSEGAMCVGPRPNHNLGTLFADDPDTAMDNILNEFGTYDYK